VVSVGILVSHSSTFSNIPWGKNVKTWQDNPKPRSGRSVLNDPVRDWLWFFDQETAMDSNGGFLKNNYAVLIF
jgi:hypothetical protein